MSKDRARRRAEREALAAMEHQRRTEEQAKAARRRTRRARRARLGALARRPAEPGSALARQRRRQNGALLAFLVPLNAVVWLLEPGWLWRASALVLSVLAWPVLVVLFFDRRPT